MSRHVLACALLALVPGLAAASQTAVVTFSSGNQGGWTWGNAFDQIVLTGGNPDAHLRNMNLDTFAPQPRTAGASVFTGDYRARRVTNLGIDLRTYATQFNFSREVTLLLEHDPGTPANPNDDCIVYFKSPFFVPQPAQGWASFEFSVPSQSAGLPPGWQVLQACGTNDQTWNSVITDVTRVRWFYGDPTFFFIFDIWQVGLDNPRITWEVGEPFCAGDGSASACPCGNQGGPQRGCASSTGPGAFLDAAGTTSVAADDLALLVIGMPATAPALLYQGTQRLNGGAGAAFGDGLRCVSGTITRLGTRTASGGAAAWGPGLAGAGGWGSGQTRHFQAWYRNLAGPCGSGFNLTNGRSVTFTP